MPAALSDVRAGLAAALGTISGLRVNENATDDPVPPCAVLSMNTLTFDSTLARGADQMEWTVTLIVGRADDRAAMRRLETWMAGSGATSVKAAIEADTTLGGRVLMARVVEFRNIGSVDRGDGSSLLVADAIVTIYA